MLAAAKRRMRAWTLATLAACALRSRIWRRVAPRRMPSAVRNVEAAVVVVVVVVRVVVFMRCYIAGPVPNPTWTTDFYESPSI